ncbi:hypothetical protein SAMN02745146_0044 [Hymenobacter daecheongensis DSM 21074]|uniref:Lipoprotein n=1 Tax=Hymenobacter daecheongensis DSM 21074 TaxID=1121955 RepID=A0A1M6LTB3_9BACT|nr:hypothetical protein [Hymenobacter daecheongensis]SHJ74395.1 hypothetical protein SAMN02745146_0044 [Hymenobacter daecheongensis DSM 21074]
MKTRLLLLYTVLLLGAASCKSTERAVFRLSGSPIPTRLPMLEASVDIGPWVNTEGALPEDARLLFLRELRQNVTVPTDSAQFGYAKLVITNSSMRRAGKAFLVTQMLTLMTPTLIGIPMEYYCTKLEATVQILNAKGETLGTYTGTGDSRIRVAMYHGYGQTGAPRLSDVTALKQALNEIRPKLAADAGRLRDELMVSGPLEAALGQ